ncbi:MAG: NAD-dependent protein deacetylase [Polyangiales bacterium]
MRELKALLSGRPVVALTGAGVSTDSGIPDYRGPDGVMRHAPPVQYQDFVRSEARRKRYWARSVVGWPRFSRAAPNEAHRALAAMEARGALRGVITQNVDGLHGAAGSARVIELHGALSRVRCLACGAVESRDSLQNRLIALNPWVTRVHADVAPDGDSEVAREVEARFVVAPCETCGGMLKPDVVFFGENVPKPVVDDAWRLFDEAAVLLVLGTSLTVFSGYRFVLRAAERGVDVAIINRGATRGDEVARVKLDAGVADALAALEASTANARTRDA